MPRESQPWFVYLLLCSDQTLYTGITTDPQQRLHEHNHSDRGARYTRGRRPVRLVYCEQVADRSQALRREYRIKGYSRRQKEALVQNFQASSEPLATGPLEQQD